MKTDSLYLAVFCVVQVFLFSTLGNRLFYESFDSYNFIVWAAFCGVGFGAYPWLRPFPKSEAPPLFRVRVHSFAVHPDFIDGGELWHRRGIDPLCRVAKQFTVDDASSGIGWFHRVVVLVRQVLFQPSCLTMTTAEKIEGALIPVLGVSVWMVAPEGPMKTNAGTLLLWSSALLLFQSLVRDLWLLRKAKTGRSDKSGAEDEMHVRRVHHRCVWCDLWGRAFGHRRQSPNFDAPLDMGYF